MKLDANAPNEILDSSGQLRGHIIESANDKIKVLIIDKFGRVRIGLTEANEIYSAMVYDDFAQPRLMTSIQHGRPTITVYGPDGKLLYSILANESQGEQPELISDLLRPLGTD